MTGLWVIVAAVGLTLGFGGYRRLTDGKARAVRDVRPRLDAARLGVELGSAATLVQFSTAVCAPCRATHRVLLDLTRADPRLVHVELDVEQHLDLVEELGITRTPTVVIVDADGAVRQRLVGATRRAEVLMALNLTVSAAT